MLAASPAQILAAIIGKDGDFRGRFGKRGLCREQAASPCVQPSPRSMLLDHLEVANGFAKLHPLGGIAGRHLQERLKRTGHLSGAQHCATEEEIGWNCAWKWLDMDRRSAVEDHGVARFTGEIGATLELGGARRIEHDQAGRLGHQGDDSFQIAAPGQLFQPATDMAVHAG